MAIANPRSQEAAEQAPSEVQEAHRKVQAFIRELAQDSSLQRRRNHKKAAEVAKLLNHPLFKNPATHSSLENYLRSASKAALDVSSTQEVRENGETLSVDDFFTEFAPGTEYADTAQSLQTFFKSLKDYEQRVVTDFLFIKAHSMGLDGEIRGKRKAVTELIDLAIQKVGNGKTMEQAIKDLIDNRKRPGEKICDFINENLGEANPSGNTVEDRIAKEYMRQIMDTVKGEVSNPSEVWDKAQKAAERNLKDMRAIYRLVNECLENAQPGTWTNPDESGVRRRIITNLPPRYRQIVWSYVKMITQGRLNREELAQHLERNFQYKAIEKITTSIREQIRDAA